MAGVLDEVIDISIRATTATPSLPGFGIPAILAYHTHNTDHIRFYNDLPGMVADGFSTTEAAYLMATSICNQNPRPAKFGVIRGTTAVAQSYTFTVTDNANGHKVGVTILDSAGTKTDCFHTVSSQTTDQVATDVATLLNALADSTSSATGSIVTFTGSTSGKAWWISNAFGGTVMDTTGDADPEVDLTATLLVDNTWYGISSEFRDPTNITAIASWANTNKRLYGFTTMDDDNFTLDSGIIEAMQDLDYDYVYGLYSATPETYGATGWMGGQLVATPGSNNWAFKQIPGTPDDGLNATYRDHIITNGGNIYIEMAGVPITKNGLCVSGQPIDLTVGIDSLRQHVQLRVATLLTTLPKLEYTRAGLSAVRGAVMAGLQDSVRDTFLSNDSGFEPQVSVPNLEDVSATDKANRVLDHVTFVCFVRGAINSIKITGTVNV